MSKLYDLLSAMCGKIKKPDWKQNDPTAPDYVKNRPFYTGDPVTTTIIDNQTIVMEQTQVTNAVFAKLTIGNTYFVTWDGVEYECVAEDDGDGCAMLGNQALPGWGEDTGEPFFMDLWVDWSQTNAEIGTHTVSIAEKAIQIKKVDPIYLPTFVRSNVDFLFVNLDSIFASYGPLPWTYDTTTYNDAEDLWEQLITAFNALNDGTVFVTAIDSLKAYIYGTDEEMVIGRISENHFSGFKLYITEVVLTYDKNTKVLTATRKYNRTYTINHDMEEL